MRCILVDVPNRVVRRGRDEQVATRVCGDALCGYKVRVEHSCAAAEGSGLRVNGSGEATDESEQDRNRDCGGRPSHTKGTNEIRRPVGGLVPGVASHREILVKAVEQVDTSTRNSGISGSNRSFVKVLPGAGEGILRVLLPVGIPYWTRVWETLGMRR